MPILSIFPRKATDLLVPSSTRGKDEGGKYGLITKDSRFVFIRRRKGKRIGLREAISIKLANSFRRKSSDVVFLTLSLALSLGRGGRGRKEEGTIDGSLIKAQAINVNSGD